MTVGQLLAQDGVHGLRVFFQRSGTKVPDRMDLFAPPNAFYAEGEAQTADSRCASCRAPRRPNSGAILRSWFSQDHEGLYKLPGDR